VSDPLNPEIETYCGDLSTPRSQHETGSEPRSTTSSNAEPAPERPAADASNSMLDAPMASYEPSAAADGQEGDPGTPSDREAADAAVMPAARPKTNPMPLHHSQERVPADAPASQVGPQGSAPATSREPDERGPGDAVSLAGPQGSAPATSREPDERGPGDAVSLAGPQASAPDTSRDPDERGPADAVSRDGRQGTQPDDRGPGDAVSRAGRQGSAPVTSRHQSEHDPAGAAVSLSPEGLSSHGPGGKPQIDRSTSETPIPANRQADESTQDASPSAGSPSLESPGASPLSEVAQHPSPSAATAGHSAVAEPGRGDQPKPSTSDQPVRPTERAAEPSDVAAALRAVRAQLAGSPQALRPNTARTTRNEAHPHPGQQADVSTSLPADMATRAGATEAAPATEGGPRAEADALGTVPGNGDPSVDTELVVEDSSTRVDSMSSGHSVVNQGGVSDGGSGAGAVVDDANSGGPRVGSARGWPWSGDAPESTGAMSAGQGYLAEGGASGKGDADSGGTAGEGSGGPVQAELDELADPDRLRSAVEAVLLVVDTPTSAQMLAQVLGRSVPEVEGALHSLRDDYDAGGRGFDLREVADGWRLYSREEFAAYVERFVLDGQRARLTQAALETLAVIAYRQPVTRSRISAIRGVSVDAVMRTLLTRGLVEECGADPDTGGGLYRTTSLFLEKMGLRSLDELPSLAPLLPDTSQLDDVELST